MTTYLFCIGGTGARVLRSLTMLLASGAKIGKGDSIVPIIIDYDITNGDLSRTQTLLDRYSWLHDIAVYGKDEAGFFSAPLQLRDFSFVDIKNEVGRETFKKYLDFPTLQNVSPSTAALMTALYDDSPIDDPRTELNLELSKGFKGNPNIGSVVFNEYFSNPKYGYSSFRGNFKEGDRVFIVGSIFGGTGSSGLPSLVKKFRQSGNTTNVGNNPHLKDAPIGTCVVLPYFDVAQKDTSAINSLTFMSKAKAALTYYDGEINKKLNEIYYIGCLKSKVAYPNFEGGPEQRNDAHIVELLSAMSVLEFVNRETKEMVNLDSEGDLVANKYEYQTSTGIVKKDDVAQLPDPAYFNALAIPADTDAGVYGKYGKYMNMFAYFAKYCMDYTFAGKDEGSILGQNYYKGKSGLGRFINVETDFGDNLFKFCELFKDWTYELGTNSLLAFKPYDFSHDMSLLLNIQDETTKVKKYPDDYRTPLNKEYDDLGGADYENKCGQFLRMGYKASEVAVHKLVR